MIKKLGMIMGLFILGCFIGRPFTEAVLPPFPANQGVFILKDIKKLPFSGYKVFNAGVLKIDDHYLFATRKRGNSYLHTLWKRVVLKENIKGLYIGEMDCNFKEIGEATSYSHVGKEKEIQYIDPRLLRVGEAIYMVYCRQQNGENRKTSKALLHLAKLEKISGKWQVIQDSPLVFEGGEAFYQKGLVERNFEKNWMPFSENGELFFIYLMEPDHIVLKADLQSGKVNLFSSSKNDFKKEINAPRGSTPAVYDEELGGYITCYHFVYPTQRKVLGKKVDAYFFGAYLFSKTPPFKILKRTKGPIIGKGFYDNFHKIIFPTSLIREGENYLVFYGNDDSSNKVATVSRKDLIDAMEEVEGD